MTANDLPRSGAGLFPGHAVGVWDDANDAGRNFGKTQRVPKRKRHMDELDAEYDRGKEKKVRKSVEAPRAGDGKLVNPFDKVAARRSDGNGAPRRRY